MAEIDIISINNKKMQDVEARKDIETINTQLEDILNNVPHNISSKVLTTVSANNVKLDDVITVNNISINKDRRYYIEFLGIKKLCSLSLDGEEGGIICSINNYKIEAYKDSTNITIYISKINDKINDVTFTDLVIHEEEIKYLDSKYLETDLVLQNSISVGRIGNIGAGSSAVGYGVEASGVASHAEGNGNTASAVSSHAEGDFTIASGNASHAEGGITTASGNYSHAEGNGTTASGDSSHAEGYNTIASGQYQHVQGKYNINDATNKYAHIVGNGTSNNARSNAYTLDWEGNGWYLGKLSQDGTPTEDKDLITKKYLNDILNTILKFNDDGELVVTIDEISKIFIPKA